MMEWRKMWKTDKGTQNGKKRYREIQKEQHKERKK
jgi:hypothetical protein